MIIAITGEQNKGKGIIQMSSSQRKRFRDRDRYLQMTPDQKEAYLQRNREYKRMRCDCGASCSDAKPTPQQRNSRTSNEGGFSKSVKGTVLIFLRQNVRLSSYIYCIIFLTG